MPRGAHSLSPQTLYGSASDIPQKRARRSAGPSLFLLLLSRTEKALLLSALLLSDQHDRRDSPRDNDDAGNDDARDRAGGQPAMPKSLSQNAERMILYARPSVVPNGPPPEINRTDS